MNVARDFSLEPIHYNVNIAKVLCGNDDALYTTFTESCVTCPECKRMMHEYKKGKKVFHCAGECVKGDCNCHLYDGKIMDLMESVPRHDGCTCYATRIQEKEGEK